jgi:hypothetical protein
VTVKPYALWDDVAELWVRAARLASDREALGPVRGRAAALCRLLSTDVAADAGRALLAIEAASNCLEWFPLVRDMLIAAYQLAPDDEILLEPMLRLCAAAHEAGCHETVIVTIFEMLEIPSFEGRIPSGWLVAACVVTFEADSWLRRVVRLWTQRFGADDEGIRAVVRDRAEQWFLTEQFGIEVLRTLHVAVPMTAGWIALAQKRSELPPGPLGLSFGDRHAEAVTALRAALERIHPAPVHAALTGWLEEISQ